MEEMISELEDSLLRIFESAEQKGKKKEKNEETLGNLQDTTESTNSYIASNFKEKTEWNRNHIQSNNGMSLLIKRKIFLRS